MAADTVTAKSWRDYDTTEEAFEALRVMRGGEPTADELAEKAGVRFDLQDWDKTVTDVNYIRADHISIGFERLGRICPNGYQGFGHHNPDQLEAIAAKMKELQGCQP